MENMKRAGLDGPRYVSYSPSRMDASSLSSVSFYPTLHLRTNEHFKGNNKPHTEIRHLNGALPSLLSPPSLSPRSSLSDERQPFY